MVRLVLAVALVAVAIVLWRRVVRDVPERHRGIVDVGEVVTLVVLVTLLFALAVQNLRSPGPWDFPVFYTVGRNVVLGFSFYDPQALLPTFEGIQQAAGVPNDWLSDGFGFWYAPPTALVLAPVGISGDYSVGLAVQYVMQFGFLVASALVLHRFFPLRPGTMGLVEMGILLCAFRPVAEAVSLAQIVFGAVLATAIALVTVRDRPLIAGVALGLGTLFKHLLLIPAILAVAIDRARLTVSAIMTIALSAIVAAIAFGGSVYREFVTFGPSDRPPTIALDREIESLNGFLRRLFDAVPSDSGALEAILYPPYLAVAGVVTVATLAAVWRARRSSDATVMSLAAIVVLALIVYPNTLYNTLPILVPVIIVMVWSANDLRSPGWVTFTVAASAYPLVLTRLVPGIVVMTVVWIFLIVELARSVPSGAGTRVHPSVAG